MKVKGNKSHLIPQGAIEVSLLPQTKLYYEVDIATNQFNLYGGQYLVVNNNED